MLYAVYILTNDKLKTTSPAIVCPRNSTIVCILNTSGKLFHVLCSLCAIDLAAKAVESDLFS